MKLKLFISCVLAIGLSGCVTPYQPNGLGGGYSDMALAPDIYKVSFRGNGFTSQDLVQNYVLRRCAEITLREGYSYFLILGGNTATNRDYFSTPTTINSNSYGNFSGNGMVYGNNYSYAGNSYGNTYTTINPGTTHEIEKFASVMIIKLFKDNKKAPFAMDAQTILSNYTGPRGV